MEVCMSHSTLAIRPSLNHLSSLKTRHFPGVVSYKRSKVIRASFDENKNEEVATLKDDVNDVRLDTDTDTDTDTVVPVKANETTVQSQFQVDGESSLSDADADADADADDASTLQPLQELFNKLNLQLDVEDTPTILLYGGGALVAVWLLSAIVGAIDSIPVFPKLLEVVGLGYSVWFTTRYLLFKKNREELGSKIEELKQEIFGTNDKY